MSISQFRIVNTKKQKCQDVKMSSSQKKQKCKFANSQIRKIQKCKVQSCKVAKLGDNLGGLIIKWPLRKTDGHYFSAEAIYFAILATYFANNLWLFPKK